MATLILTAVGTAVGGPIGGSIGALIGRQADAAIFGGASREGPRLRELSVTTSSYGQPMPRHFGRMRVAGSVIWSTELIESTSKEGGGKGKPSTKSYSYSASFAVALASTPIDRIGRIWADGNLLRGVNGDLKVEGEMRTYPGTGDNPVDPLIAADRGTQAPAFRDCAYVVFEDLQLADFGNRIPALNFEIFAPQDDMISLGQLVPQSAHVSGDVILENARGFSDEGGSLGSTLAAIDGVFPLSCVTTEEGLRFASTNILPNLVPVLPEQLSTRNSDDAEERNKQRGGSSGREPLALRYYDEDRDYQPGVQRALGLRSKGRETIIDLPAALTSSGARQLANSNAHRSRWLDEQIVWRIGELNPQIGPGSVVKISETSGFWVIKSWEWFDRGIELILERLAPELGAVVPSDAGTANTPIDISTPPTLLRAIELPPFDSANTSSPVIFAVASAQSAGWRGASLFVEQGSALTALGTASSRRAVFGSLTLSMGSSACNQLEPNAYLEIALPATDLFFESTDVSGLAMGANRLLIGNEIVQFLQADLIDSQRWKLSGLLRGRAGTEEAAADGHDIGTLAVLLDDRLTALDTTQVSSASNTRIAAIGRGDDEAVFAELQNAGLSLRPPSPVHPKLSILADESWQVCWTRRARGQWAWADGNDVPLVEEQELYTVSYGPSDSPLVAWSVNEARFVLSSNDRANLVSDHGAGSLWVRQFGTYGQSRARHLVSIL